MSREKPRDHNELLLVLKRTLNPEALEDMKVVVRAPEFGGFLDAELEKIKNVRDMLLVLEVRGVLGVGKYMKLRHIMESIGYVAVLEDIAQAEQFLREKGYAIESEASNTEMTSKRVSQQHKSLDDSSGYDILSEASNTEMTTKRVPEPRQPLDDSSGYGTESAASNTEMTSKRVSQPHQPLDDSSEVSVETELKQFKHLKITKATGLDASSARLRQVAAPAVAEPLSYAIESEASNTEMTSKRVSQPHQPRDDSSGEIASFMVTDGPLQAADKVVKILRNRYKTTGSFVHLIPWVGEDMKPISDIYTKLKRLYTGYRGKLLNSYDEIFLEKTVKPVKEGDSRPRIILKGRAGIGKSTLVDKMAYDWANGEKLQEYKLVFVLKMFALEESSEFIDAIFHQLMDEEVAISKDDLMSYITTNPAKVLVLFDGFDEFKTTGVKEDSQPPNVSQILNGKLLSDSYVVVTTRHSHFHKLVSKSLIEKPFVYVKVLGFTEKDIEQYIRRFFSEERDRSEGLIQKIKSSDDLLDLATSPMLLLLMCLLWGEQSTIPDTMYRLYKDALRYIFQRKQLPPHEESKVVITIGKNALDDLLSPRQFLSFKEGDFEDQALRSALKAGILTSQRVIKGLDTQQIVSFIHRTFQEYCAAIFFQSLLGTYEEQFNSNLERVGNIMKDSPKGLEYLVRFCCGDNQACTNVVLSLIQKCSRKRMMIVEELSVKCYFEGQFEDLPSVDLVTEKMSVKRYSNDGLSALFYYLKHVKADDKKKGRENTQLSKVTSLSISWCNLESFSEVLGNAMKEMINLANFELRHCIVTSVSLKFIASSFVNTPKLREISIVLNKKCKGIEGSLPLWGHNLRSLKLLERFTLKGSECHYLEDHKYIAASLGLMKSLVYCFIGTGSLHFSSETLVAFDKKNRVTHLNLLTHSLTSAELSDVLSGLKTREDSFYIDLSDNPRLGDLANKWAQQLKNLQNLRQLVLQNCALQSKDIEPLAGSLSDMSTLATLDLSGNPSLSGNAASWAAHLGQLNPLKEMSLRNCFLTGVDIEHIAKSVGNITTLDLSANFELRHSVASWAPSLRHFKHVEKICLNACGLSFDDKTLISKVQQEMSNIVDIQLMIEGEESPPPLLL